MALIRGPCSDTRCESKKAQCRTNMSVDQGMRMHLSTSDKGFKNCGIPDEIGGKEDDEGVRTFGSEHECEQ
jgi:hypothetical protein